MSTLYLVATPIGNLEDLTYRAVRILQEVTLIAAEDTRITARMLQHYDINTPMRAFHGNSSASEADQLIAKLSTGDIAVVSDAGMPGISDPGSQLVQRAIAADYGVIPIPGASAISAAAAASGVVDAGYIFAGFLPRKANARRERLTDLACNELPIIIFESPHRIIATLKAINECLPDATVTVGREITKIYEEWLRGKPDEILPRLNPRGEFTVVIDSHYVQAEDEAQLDNLLRTTLRHGISVRDISAIASTTFGVSRNKAYQRLLELKTEHDDLA